MKLHDLTPGQRFEPMMFYEFSKRYRCSISKILKQRPRYHARPMEAKIYHIYIDMRTMLPFNPKTDLDCLNCITFSADSSEQAKRKAYNFIKDKTIWK